MTRTNGKKKYNRNKNVKKLKRPKSKKRKYPHIIKLIAPQNKNEAKTLRTDIHWTSLVKKYNGYQAACPIHLSKIHVKGINTNFQPSIIKVATWFHILLIHFQIGKGASEQWTSANFQRKQCQSQREKQWRKKTKYSHVRESIRTHIYKLTTQVQKINYATSSTWLILHQCSFECQHAIANWSTCVSVKFAPPQWPLPFQQNGSIKDMMSTTHPSPSFYI